MCGNSDLQLQFVPVIGGKITILHRSLIMGGFRIEAAEQIRPCEMYVSKMNIDLNKLNLFHQAWLAKVYNSAISGQTYWKLDPNDGPVSSAYSVPVFGDIYPIKLVQYVPFNNWISEGVQIDVADFFRVIPEVVAIAQCKRKA